MQVIFEQDKEDDFLEVIIDDEDIDELRWHDGLVKEIKGAISKNRLLNIFIRKGTYVER